MLKAPFCIHPSTKRVCVPVDPRRAYEFDFSTVPVLKDVVESKGEAGPMAPYLKAFRLCAAAHLLLSGCDSLTALRRYIEAVTRAPKENGEAKMDW